MKFAELGNCLRVPSARRRRKGRGRRRSFGIFNNLISTFLFSFGISSATREAQRHHFFFEFSIILFYYIFLTDHQVISRTISDFIVDQTSKSTDEVAATTLKEETLLLDSTLDFLHLQQIYIASRKHKIFSSTSFDPPPIFSAHITPNISKLEIEEFCVLPTLPLSNLSWNVLISLCFYLVAFGSILPFIFAATLHLA